MFHLFSRKNEAQAKLDALDKSQAFIEFKPDGTIITANHNFLITLGYALPEIQGQHHSMFVAPEYARSTEYKEFWESLDRGEYQASENSRWQHMIHFNTLYFIGTVAKPSIFNGTCCQVGV